MRIVEVAGQPSWYIEITTRRFIVAPGLNYGYIENGAVIYKKFGVLI